MNNRLILIEGIPGSGKTTISRKIKDYLLSKDFEVVLYNEGDMHPVDMAWNALLSKEEYEHIIKENKDYENIIKENSMFEEDYVIVAYTKLGLCKNQNSLIEFFEAHEIYDGRVSIEEFKNIHLNRWRKFGEEMQKEKNKIVIFEFCYLQNHVDQLLAVHEKDLKYIQEYLIDLIKMVKHLNPKLVYLGQNCVGETINRIAKERVSDNKSNYPDWIEVVMEYYKNSNYGKNNNIIDASGVIKYYEKRQEIELEIIKKLPVESIVVNNKDYDYLNILNTIITKF